jgi:RNA polymerase sigma factor (sigma-70 family)
MRSGKNEALVVAAQRGDRRALDDLVSAYPPLVYNIVGRAMNGHADVDDVVQETLVRAIERLGDLRDPAAFRSWLAAIAIRCVRDRWRISQARLVTVGDGSGVPPDTADPGADFVDLTILRLELSGQRRETASATRWLDSDDRELLALWWLESAGEMSRAELVGALGLTAGHTSVRVQRMKQQLQTARTVVRVLAAAPRCAELSELARRWDGRPSSAWREQFARHTRECVDCSVHAQGLVPTERLLAGLGLVPVPVLIAARWSAPVSGALISSTGARDRLLVSWEHILGASCNAGTCTGKFGGTHLRIIDWSGKALGADQVVDARIAGDVAAMPDGSLVWAYAQATPDYSGPLSASPASSTLMIARLVG